MTKVTYYAIQNTSTKDYLPWQTNKVKFCKCEPIAAEMVPPRLWARRSNAEKSLTIWKKGHSYRHYADPNDDYCSNIEYIEIPSRKTLPLKVVTLQLKVNS